MKHRTLSIAFRFAVMILILIFGTSLSFGEEKTVSHGYKRFKESVFSFEMPISWQEVKGKELDQVRQQIQAQNFAQGRSLGFTGSDDFRLLYLFSAKQGEEVGIIASVIKIPPSLSKRYLDALYESTKEQIYTRFRKVFTHAKTDVNRIPVILSDVERADGGRMISYTFHSEISPSQAAGLFIIIAPGKHESYKGEIEHICRTLQVTFQAKNNQTIKPRVVFVRLAQAHLRLEPEFAKLVSLETLKFGQEVFVVNEQGDWLLVKDPTSSKTGWVHRLAIAVSSSEIVTLRQSKKIPSLLLYVDLDKGPINLIDGELLPKQDKDGWLSELPLSSVIFVASVLGIRIDAFLNGKFGDGDPRANTLYYLNESGQFERWELLKPAK